MRAGRLSVLFVIAVICASLYGVDAAARPAIAGAAGGPPAPTIDSVTPRGLGAWVAWDPPAGIAVSSYRLQATSIPTAGVPVANGCATPAPTTAPGTDTGATVRNLCAGVPYQVTMTATN